MDFQDLQAKAAFALALTKWKVDHELRLNDLRGKLHATEEQIIREKYRLAELTFELYKQGKITDDLLLKVCNVIQEFYKTAKLQENDIEKVKSEIPPKQGISQAPIANNGLVCPKCGGGIPVRFCPNCGVEGIPINTTNSNNQG